MPVDTRIRTVIVDDENHARDRLRQLLEPEADFELVDECANGRLAIAAIDRHSPDVVFLDVQMPRVDGFAVCRSITVSPPPLFVFVTAFDQHALRAFEVHAIDYLLKPFDRERFQQALSHVREQVRRARGGAADTRVAEMLAAWQKDRRRPDRLAFKADGKVVFVRVGDLDWAEADGNYVRLHTRAGTHHFRETLTALEQQLPAESFLRISRSQLVNVDRIKEVEPLFYGDATVVLHDGTKLSLSRHYRERLDQWLARPR